VELEPQYKPLKPPEARDLAREIMETGHTSFTGHAREEMAKDKLEVGDCLNVLRAGQWGPGVVENNELRYRVSTQQMCVVCTFLSSTRLRIITAWRIQ